MNSKKKSPASLKPSRVVRPVPATASVGSKPLQSSDFKAAIRELRQAVCRHNAVILKRVMQLTGTSEVGAMRLALVVALPILAAKHGKVAR